MSILRNIAIGALGEGINKMEQKDRVYAEIAVDAGKNYFHKALQNKYNKNLNLLNKYYCNVIIL